MSERTSSERGLVRLRRFAARLRCSPGAVRPEVVEEVLRVRSDTTRRVGSARVHQVVRGTVPIENDERRTVCMVRERELPVREQVGARIGPVHLRPRESPRRERRESGVRTPRLQVRQRWLPFTWRSKATRSEGSA